MRDKKQIIVNQKRFILVPNRLDLRMQAARDGRKHYSTGMPCINGHISERYTANGNCIECSKNSQREKNFIIKNLLNKKTEMG
jgi:hypothetical protein